MGCLILFLVILFFIWLKSVSLMAFWVAVGISAVLLTVGKIYFLKKEEKEIREDRLRREMLEKSLTPEQKAERQREREEAERPRRALYKAYFTTAACPSIVQEENVLAYSPEQAKEFLEKEYGLLIVCNIKLVEYC